MIPALAICSLLISASLAACPISHPLGCITHDATSGNYYLITTDTYSWADAFSLAESTIYQKHNGHLFAPTTDAEVTFVKALISTTGWTAAQDVNTAGSTNTYTYWYGDSKVPHSGDYDTTFLATAQWDTTSKATADAGFAAGQKSCVYINQAGKFFADDCADVKNTAVIEFKCASGLEFDGNQCSPANRCETNNGGCGPVSAVTCGKNRKGPYFCRCKHGFFSPTHNGINCQARLLCKLAHNFCGANSVCTEPADPATSHVPTCVCNAGYHSLFNNGSECVRRVNCADNNPCGVHSTCSQIRYGVVTCACNSGYASAHNPANGRDCSIVVNPCAVGANGHTDCGPNAKCSAAGPIVTCTCNAGYVHQSPGKGGVCVKVTHPYTPAASYVVSGFVKNKVASAKVDAFDSNGLILIGTVFSDNNGVYKLNLPNTQTVVYLRVTAGPVVNWDSIPNVPPYDQYNVDLTGALPPIF